MLGMPALCDIIATALMNVGLLALSMSAVQMLRGSMAMFAAVVRIPVIGVRPKAYMWLGWGERDCAELGFNELGEYKSHRHEPRPSDRCGLGAARVLWRRLQFVAEEAVLGHYDANVCDGGRRTLGLALCRVGISVAAAMPGNDRGGCVENAAESWELFASSGRLRLLVTILLLVLYLFNVQQMLINYRLGSVYNSLIATCRPVGVWILELVLFYTSSGRLGDGWAEPRLATVMDCSCCLPGCWCSITTSSCRASKERKAMHKILKTASSMHSNSTAVYTALWVVSTRRQVPRGGSEWRVVRVCRTGAACSTTRMRALPAALRG